ncbi:uncharacterized protein LOC119733721 [Patiria miniata]|uniref:Uncharacterized protein n=1 Tax=Patiria miniata TaxID=46514 RepID=A0A914AH35_PATMI|nr:uncharacterized protein LOC119733721 [Patiria miniata]
MDKERVRKKTNYVPMAERSERQQRITRRSWRRSTKKYRDAKKDVHDVLPDSPPSTPEVPNAANLPPPTPRRLVDRRTDRGRKKVKRDRAKAYRQVEASKRKLKQQVRLVARWKKRYSRIKEQLLEMGDSPRSKTRKLLRHCVVDRDVTKELVFHHVLLDELREKYRQNNMLRDKQKIRRVAASNIVKKYRMVKRLSSTLGVNAHRLIRKDMGKNLNYARVQRSDRVNDETKQLLNDFFERDDNSRQMPGKKDTITRHKVKKQKRLLNDSLTVLHAKFLYENSTMTMHYSFCRLRPWWVVKPTLSDLDSCMCKRCTNMDLMNQKLAAERITATVEESMKSAVCDTHNKACMYGECEACKGKRVNFQLPAHDKQVKYQQWVTKEKLYGDGKSTNVTVKETFEISLSSLCEKYEAELKPRFTTHHFNIFHQYAELRKLKANLDGNSVAVHIDFSENYGCKYSEEIQSVHFGGSHQQASLHTGVYYTYDGCHAFCTISACTRHDPPGIWGHLVPVLREIKQRYPAVTTVHFISDGPTTQYRNKKNFWLGSTIPKTMGFDKVTWNFMEAGHGKGAPDGVGGVLKRTADSLVSQGKDIPTAHELYESLKPVTNINLILLEEEEINKFDDKLPTDLISVNGTMKVHQVLFTDDPEVVDHRELSCFCNGMPCFKTTQARLRRTEERTTKKRTTEERTTEERATEQRTTKERTT